MKYELQTILGVSLDPTDTLSGVADRLRSAMFAVLKNPEYGGVSEIRVEPVDQEQELLVGVRFVEGVRAEFVDELATDILMDALQAFHDEETTVSEESVRLQSVYA